MYIMYMLYQSERQTDITDFKNNRNGGTIGERKDKGDALL